MNAFAWNEGLEALAEKKNSITFDGKEKFCLWSPKSWALESVIQLKESGIPPTITMWNPSSTDKESEIHSV